MEKEQFFVSINEEAPVTPEEWQRISRAFELIEARIRSKPPGRGIERLETDVDSEGIRFITQVIRDDEEIEDMFFLPGPGYNRKGHGIGQEPIANDVSRIAHHNRMARVTLIYADNLAPGAYLVDIGKSALDWPASLAAANMIYGEAHGDRNWRGFEFPAGIGTQDKGLAQRLKRIDKTKGIFTEDADTASQGLDINALLNADDAAPSWLSL